MSVQVCMPEKEIKKSAANFVKILQRHRSYLTKHLRRTVWAKHSAVRKFIKNQHKHSVFIYYATEALYLYTIPLHWCSAFIYYVTDTLHLYTMPLMLCIYILCNWCSVFIYYAAEALYLYTMPLMLCISLPCCSCSMRVWYMFTHVHDIIRWRKTEIL